MAVVVVVLTALDEQADTVTASKASKARTARREETRRGREVEQRDMGITPIVQRGFPELIGLEAKVICWRPDTVSTLTTSGKLEDFGTAERAL